MKKIINEAVQILRQGGLVAFPTETVYGLGADARNPEALIKLFKAKGRPIDHPVIVHIADSSQLEEWAVEISDTARLLINRFWPGPLTLILKKAPDVLDIVTGGQLTIGLRSPNHPLAIELLKNFGGGIAAPSANRFGRISPTTAEAVIEELNGAVDRVIEGGPCEVGVESTIVDVSGEECLLLRPGMITVAEIEAVLQKPLMPKNQKSPRVSGALETHYAPLTETVLVENMESYVAGLLKEDLVALVTRGDFQTTQLQIKLSNEPKQYAHDLYQVLRELDKKKLKRIAIEMVPLDPSWDAVRDRLLKAASGRIF